MRWARCRRSALGCALGCALAGLTGCHKSRVNAAPPAIAPPPAGTTKPATTARLPTTSRTTNAPSATVEGEPKLGRPVSVEEGLASWYGPPYHNRPAADGSIFDQNALTAAHRTLPMGTTVRVTNLATNQSVVAKITDRGPFVTGRTLDLSLAAAKEIGVYRAGVSKVRIEVFAHPGSDPEGRWCVQIGAFLAAEDAVQLKNDLQVRYKTAKVIEFQGPTGFWVRINPAIPDRGTASRIADAIHVPDAESWLVRTN